MIVPKVHTDRLGELDSNAAVEYVKLIDRYESEGYKLYARTPSSVVKSVKHQHTHLLQLDGKEKHFVFLLRKPFYIRLSR
jgi:diadenosine tetraphosphate (Ap4A) HIT family hydrolase